MSTVSVDRSPPRRAFTLPTARERGLYHANPWHRTAIAGDSWQAFPGPRRLRIAWQDDPPQPLSSSSTSCRRPPPASRSSRTGSPRLLLIISVSSTPIPGANFRPYLSGSTRARPPRCIPGGRIGMPGIGPAGMPGRPHRHSCRQPSQPRRHHRRSARAHRRRARRWRWRPTRRHSWMRLTHRTRQPLTPSSWGSRKM